jgi:hypothetical protein
MQVFSLRKREGEEASPLPRPPRPRSSLVPRPTPEAALVPALSRWRSRFPGPPWTVQRIERGLQLLKRQAFSRKEQRKSALHWHGASTVASRILPSFPRPPSAPPTASILGTYLFLTLENDSALSSPLPSEEAGEDTSTVTGNAYLSCSLSSIVLTSPQMQL